MIPLSFNSLFNQDFASRILEHGPNPKNGKSSDKAHPPIHPLKVGDSLQVYCRLAILLITIYINTLSDYSHSRLSCEFRKRFIRLCHVISIFNTNVFCNRENYNCSVQIKE